MFRCTNDRFDPDGSQPYFNVEDFLAMCEVVFNHRPKLMEQSGRYFDEYGITTLVPVEVWAETREGYKATTGERLVCHGPHGRWAAFDARGKCRGRNHKTPQSAAQKLGMPGPTEEV